MSSNNTLYQQWKALFLAFNADENLCLQEYQKVDQAYGKSNRHYHTMAHIETMVNKALELGETPTQNPVLFWSIWLHDVVYSSFAKDNEAKSAHYAAELFLKISVNEAISRKVQTYIGASAKHTERNDDDNLNLFLDLDLMILGQPENIYKDYTEKVRAEYSLVPLPLYRNGRRKMLQKFLAVDKIYHSAPFEKYEVQARENLNNELQALS